MRLLGVSVILMMAMALGLTACQKIGEPVPTLTQDQWQRISEHILEAPPEGLEGWHPVGAVFGNKVELVGYTLEPSDRVEVGSDVIITWYWRVMEDFDERLEIFVHLDSRAPHRQQLDHEAIEGMYTTVYWEAGQIIRDAQQFTVEQGHANQEVVAFVGFWRRWSDESRLEVSNPGQGRLEADGRLRVGSFEVYRPLLTYEARRLTGEITIDGQLNEPDWEVPQTASWVRPNDGEAAPNDIRTRGRAVWDDEALYVGLSAQDGDVWSSLAERDSNLWDEEVLEVYLDPIGDGRNYVEIQVNPLGTIFDAVFPEPSDRDLESARAVDLEGLEARVDVQGTVDSRDDSDRRWTVEMRIPWASLPDFDGQPSEGMTLRANFYRYDRPADGETHTLAWSPVFGGSFHQPDKFGEIRLVSQAAGRRRGRGARNVPEGTGAVRTIDGRPVRMPQPILPHQIQPRAREELETPR